MIDKIRADLVKLTIEDILPRRIAMQHALQIMNEI
jgi:hypothetical protein